MRAALKNYFVGSAYRTPNGQELKTWLDIRSPEDFWDWTQIHFASLYHLETYYNRDTFSRVGVDHLSLLVLCLSSVPFFSVFLGGA
jgi:hypothetical protein